MKSAARGDRRQVVDILGTWGPVRAGDLDEAIYVAALHRRKDVIDELITWCVWPYCVYDVDESEWDDVIFSYTQSWYSDDYADDNPRAAHVEGGRRTEAPGFSFDEWFMEWKQRDPDRAEDLSYSYSHPDPKHIFSRAAFEAWAPPVYFFEESMREMWNNATFYFTECAVLNAFLSLRPVQSFVRNAPSQFVFSIRCKIVLCSTL